LVEKTKDSSISKQNTTHWYARRLARKIANAAAPVLFFTTPASAILCLTSAPLALSGSLLGADVTIAALAFWVFFHDPEVFGPAVFS
jgi:hypothetical protein